MARARDLTDINCKLSMASRVRIFFMSRAPGPPSGEVEVGGDEDVIRRLRVVGQRRRRRAGGDRSGDGGERLDGAEAEGPGGRAVKDVVERRSEDRLGPNLARGTGVRGRGSGRRGAGRGITVRAAGYAGYGGRTPSRRQRLI